MIFFHFLSFSFIFFVGCSNLIFFLGLNFVTIALNNSYVKNHFLGTSRVGRYPFGPSFLLFLLLFFSRFLFFFLLFIFHFFRRKSFFFSFFLYSFKYVQLLALVLEFNCFFRSRCSMEMWCPDDTGRGIAGIGLGRLLGGGHASTPQSGVESSPVKTEPPQIVLLLLLLLFSTRLFTMCISTMRLLHHSC